MTSSTQSNLFIFPFLTSQKQSLFDSFYISKNSQGKHRFFSAHENIFHPQRRIHTCQIKINRAKMIISESKDRNSNFFFLIFFIIQVPNVKLKLPTPKAHFGQPQKNLQQINNSNSFQKAKQQTASHFPLSTSNPLFFSVILL